MFEPKDKAPRLPLRHKPNCYADIWRSLKRSTPHEAAKCPESAWNSKNLGFNGGQDTEYPSYIS